jgi:hypothetical protein
VTEHPRARTLRVEVDEERMQLAKANMSEDLKALEKLGLK